MQIQLSFKKMFYRATTDLPEGVNGPPPSRWNEKTGLLDAACSKLLPRLKTHFNLGASKETSQ
jgi:hypothetical protein